MVELDSPSPKSPKDRPKVFSLVDRTQLVWLGIAGVQFFVLAILYIVTTEAFFSIGGDIGSGVFTTLSGVMTGAIQAAIGTLACAKAFYSRGRAWPAVFSWAAALLATMALLALGILAFDSGPIGIVRTLRIYIWSPGGRILPQEVSLLLSGALLTSVLAFAANCVAGVVLARRRLPQQLGAALPRSGASIRWGWRITLGLGGAAFVLLLATFFSGLTSGWPPAVHQAIDGGELSVLEEVLDRDPSACNTTDFREKTALLLAIEKGRLDMATLLLERGAYPNVPDRYGFTPLHTAAGAGRVDLAALLLEKGAVTDVVSRTSSMTPLQLAASRGHEKVVELLVSHGAEF